MERGILKLISINDGSYICSIIYESKGIVNTFAIRI